MMTASKLHLILDDLAAIKEFLPQLSASELTSLGTALVTLTNDARTAYKNAARQPASITHERQPMYAERFECDTCNAEWRGPQMVLPGTPAKRATCGVCKAKQRQPVIPMMMPTDSIPPVQTMALEATTEPQLIFTEILDGTYTVVFSNNDYRTIKIDTQPLDAEFAPGKRVASYLNGPDNYRNYKGFAFLTTDGRYNLYRAFAANNKDSQIEMALRVLLSGREAMIQGLRAYGIAAGKCGMCGHKLTTPESIKRGIGPECAGKLGLK